MLWEESYAGIHQSTRKMNKVDPRSNQAGNISGGQNDETEAALLWVHRENATSSGKYNHAGKH